MMIDQQLVLSDAQDLTVTANSTNVIDLGIARDLGAGERVSLLLTFGTVVSNATLVVELDGADDAGMSVNSIALAVSKTLTPTTGSMYLIPIPDNTPKRYIRIGYTVAGGSSPHIPTSASLVKNSEVKPHSRTL